MAMMMHKLKNNKITIGVCIIIVLFAGVLYWILSSQDQEDSEQKKNDNLVEFEGSTLEEKKDGKLIWSLTADKIQVDPDTKIIYVTHPHIIIADVDGEEMKIEAPMGIVDRNKQMLQVKPPIKATTDNGSTLQTEGSVYYNMDTRLIKGGKVYMQKADGTALSGDAFETDASLNKVTLTGHAKVTKGE